MKATCPPFLSHAATDEELALFGLSAFAAAFLSARFPPIHAHAAVAELLEFLGIPQELKPRDEDSGFDIGIRVAEYLKAKRAKRKANLAGDARTGDY
ncbi:MAG: hypothetical protein ABFD89_17610 [Bryobacteraceae bacterium]